jgi:hypothetical protein
MLRSDPVICLVLRGMAAPEAVEFLKIDRRAVS